MATIEIRDVLDNETGQTIFPRTHVNAVIGLKDSNFFEAVSDGNGGFSVKLRSEYQGLWAEGFVSSGGINSGGGGGGGGGGLITSVKGVADLGTPIQSESLTETFSAKAIESIFEGLGDFGVSLSLSRVASYFKDSNGNYFLDANGNRIIVGGAGSSYLNLLNKSGRVLSSVELDLDMSNYASKSWVSQNFLTQETDPTVPSWAKSSTPPSYSFSDLVSHPTTLDGYGITDAKFGSPGTDNVPITLGSTTKTVLTAHQDLTPLANRITAIEDWFEIVNIAASGADPVYALHAKNGYAIYSDSWVSSGGVGTGGGGSVGSLYDLVEVLSSTSPNTLDMFYFNGTKWTNTPLKTINGNSIIGSGNISISGGGSSVTVSNVKTTGAKIADITVDGVTTAIKDGLVWGAYDDTSKTVALTLNGQQYVLCVNGYSAGGGVASESDPVFTASAAYGITAQDITSWNAKSEFSGSFDDLSNKPTTLSGYGITDANISGGVITLGNDTITPLTSHQTIYGLTLSAGQFTGGTYTPTSSAGSFNIPTTLDHIADGTTRKLSDYVTLSTPQTIDGAKTFTAPVTVGQTSYLSMHESSHIDIGPLRIEYDATNKALHITKADSNDTNTYGLYADGFNSAGGIGQTS